MVWLQRARKRSLLALMLILQVLGLMLRPAAAAVAPAPAATGSEWVKLASPLAPGGTVLDLAVVPSAPETLFALLADNPWPRLYRSQDAALSWAQVYTFTQSISNLALDPAAPDSIYAGGDRGLYRSPDGGLSWTQVYTLGQAVAVLPPALIYAGGAAWTPACAYGPLQETLLARSTDGGATWQTVSLGCRDDIKAFAVDPTDPQRLYVATVLDSYADTYQIWGSPDGGQTWQGLLPDALTLHNLIAGLAIDPLAPQHIYYSGSAGTGASLDGGITWQKLESLPVAPVTLAFNDGSLYAAPMWSTHSVNIYRSEDGGQSWWQSLFQLPQGVNVLRPVPGQPENFYAGLSTYGVWRSANRGGSWREANQGLRSPTSWVAALAADPADPKRLLAGSTRLRPGLFESADGGLSWTLALTDTPIVDIAIHPLTTTIVYAASPYGLYSTTDGVAWSQQLPDYQVFDVGFSAHSSP